MPQENENEYGTHADFMSWVVDDALKRQQEISLELRAAFSVYIEPRESEWILFGSISVEDLAKILRSHPLVLKPIIALCNMAGRAIKRDVGFDVDTYAPRLSAIQAAALAGYIKPFLPESVCIAALEAIDNTSFIDKEIRKTKGRWEKHICESLNTGTGLVFRKRKFIAGGEPFELDAAFPPVGEPVEVGVDVKRIEARRDIHKRVDEIAQKAAKFRAVYPEGRFGAVIYYPFPGDHLNIQNRLSGPNVDGIVFAGESLHSVEEAVLMLIPQLGMRVRETLARRV